MITSINEYKLLLEKKTQKNKDLILVDIDAQITDEEYLKKLFKYCTKYSRTIQIWNKTLSDTPKYDMPNQIKEVELPEITNIDLSDIETLFYGEEKERILSMFQDGLVSGIVTGDLYKDLNGNVWTYLGHTDSGDKWAIINSETDIFFNTLKKIERKVILLGKAESISIAQPVLAAYGLNTELDSEFQISSNPVK